MIKKSDIVKLVDAWQLQSLESLYKKIGLADLPPSAKQKDVPKVQAEINKRMTKMAEKTKAQALKALQKVEKKADEGSQV
jgi:hypothetical protein